MYAQKVCSRLGWTFTLCIVVIFFLLARITTGNPVDVLHFAIDVLQGGWAIVQSVAYFLASL